MKTLLIGCFIQLASYSEYKNPVFYVNINGISSILEYSTHTLVNLLGGERLNVKDSYQDIINKINQCKKE